MVRICEVMTFACATALVAGSALAADKAVSRVNLGEKKAEVVQAPLSLRQAVQNYQASSVSTFGLGGGCSCIWFNGEFDGRDGQASHLGGAVTHGAKAADDFWLCEGYVYNLESISATTITSSLSILTKTKLEIYADCDGCPGQLLYTLEKGTATETGQTFGTDAWGTPLRIVNWTYTIANETKTENKNIVLKGGAYWISIYGLTDGQCPTMNMCDVTYWGTTGNQTCIKGAVAKKIFGVPTSSWNQFNFPGPWTTVEDCCVGCTDLAFTVCATPCKILVDNGSGRHQVGSEPVGSTSQFAPQSWSSLETRSADDFVVPPCSDYNICYVEGCVYTNCIGFQGVFELYTNDCNSPSYTLGSTPAFGPYYATKIVDLGFTAVMDGRTLRCYRLEFHKLSILVPGGKQMWISIGVKHTFSVNERAFFCYNADCRRSCLIRWNAGKVLTHNSVDSDGNPGWASVGNDFSFLIGAEPVNGSAPGGGSTPVCAVDFNRDNQVSVQDIFDFLNAWFTGCP